MQQVPGALGRPVPICAHLLPRMLPPVHRHATAAQQLLQDVAHSLAKMSPTHSPPMRAICAVYSGFNAMPCCPIGSTAAHHQESVEELSRLPGRAQVQPRPSFDRAGTASSCLAVGDQGLREAPGCPLSTRRCLAGAPGLLRASCCPNCICSPYMTSQAARAAAPAAAGVAAAPVRGAAPAAAHSAACHAA